MRWEKISALATSVLVASVATFGTYAWAQGKYPDRPVTLVVSFDAGGPTDVTARVLAEQLTVVTGQRFITLNRPGAGGIIGNQVVQHAAPDGYTLLFATSGPMTVLPAVSSQVPYDSVKDFDSVAIVSNLSPFFMLTNPQTGVKDLKSLVAQAQANPGKFKFSTPGPGGTNSAAGLAFADLAKAKMVEVPYKGGTGPSVTAVLTNEVELTYANTQTFKQYADSGKILPLAVIANQRSKQLPNVPTVAEAGFPEMMNLTSWRVWQGVLAPKGTPKDIIDYLNKSINQALNNPELQKKFETLDLEVQLGSTPASTHQTMEKDVADWKAIAQRLNLKIQ